VVKLLDEENNKDSKIYDIYKSAMETPNLLTKLKIAFVLTYQLEKKHTDQLPANFSLENERKFIKQILGNLKLNKNLNLHHKVTEGIEGYKYYDNIEDENPNNIYNYDKEIEREITKIEMRLVHLFAQIVKTLDVSTSIEELIS